MTSPYKKNSLLTLIPGGGYQITNTSDSSLSSSLTLEKNTLILTLSDDVRKNQIARVGYPIVSAGVDFCRESSISSTDCIGYSE